MNLDKKIIIIDDVLSKEECEDAINTFQKYDFETEQFRDTFLLRVNNDHQNLINMACKIRDSISFLSKDIAIDWSQVVQWAPNSRQNYHKDTASDRTILTSITYLNDEYVGGETSIENDINIIPKTGRTVYFDGNYYVHGVNEITRGVRYTFPIWYKHISVVQW